MTRFIPGQKKSKAQRLEGRILQWALAYCTADNRSREGWRQWRTLSELHFPGAVCFQTQEQTEDKDDPYAVDAREALSRDQWCKDCIEFMDTGINYQEALYDRRIAKSNMKRAFKEYVKLEGRRD